MANRTDPLVSQLGGSDPQNLLEYITRQHIYDSRYWKETCFGLTVEDVLVQAAELQSLGGRPSHFLSLALKLLQLHPESDIILENFVEQDDFKYARALGCLYLRLTGKPTDIYQWLEPLYSDSRKLRYWDNPNWKIIHMDEIIHSLLTESSVAGIALPRLPARRHLVQAGYLDQQRAIAPSLQSKLNGEYNGDAIEYLKYKARVEEYPPAVAMWEERQKRLGIVDQKKPKTAKQDGEQKESAGSSPDKNKRPKKKAKYGSLFKKSDSTPASRGATSTSTSASSKPDAAEGTTEYWNEQRAKLGLKPLKER